SRLYRILISEVVFVIWKARNDCVLNKDGEPLHPNEIHNRWVSAMSKRLNFDCGLTYHAKYGKQYVVKPSLVLQTWSSTLMDEEKLSENWIKEPRVLVSTESK
ncbi:hypothetical protein B0H19DRAFT_882624, partial [Mycena capillaripes]